MSQRIDNFFEAIHRVKDGGNTRGVALAVVDPAYVGAATAKVTFDGETSLSAKAYKVIGLITPGSRVLLFKVGPTWVISGELGNVNLAAGNHTHDPTAPAIHNDTHEPGGSDAMAIDAAAGTGSLRTLGAGATQAAVGNHTHAAPGVWSTYVPVWTNLTKGNGTLQLAHYQRIGNTVVLQIRFLFGSTTTVQGIFYPSLPVATTVATLSVGAAVAYCASIFYSGAFIPDAYFIFGANRATINEPSAWTAGAIIWASLVYEVV